MKKSIFKKNKKYTFSDYFKMRYTTKEIAATFNYSFRFDVIDLPTDDHYDKNIIEDLKKTFYTILPKINLDSEIAKRDFLISPLLIELVKIANIHIDVEYFLDVNDKLSGLLDYFLTAEQTLIVIEAKKGDIDKGFNQLVAELIAVDKDMENKQIKFIYGAVTLGDIWKFGVLDRKKKQITKNIHSHTIPEETETVFSILMGIINQKYN